VGAFERQAEVAGGKRAGEQCRREGAQPARGGEAGAFADVEEEAQGALALQAP
jgi:hypothetical protein